MPDGSTTIEIAHTDSLGAALTDAGAKRKRKVLLAALAGTVALGALAYGTYWTTVAANYVVTDNAYVGASTAQINAQIAGTLGEVRVNDADIVKRGDVLATIDPADARLAVARAEADYARVQQRVNQYYAQESVAVAQVAVRKADLDRAASNYNRRRELAATGAISREELNTAETTYQGAHANLVAAEQTLEAQRVLTRGTTAADHPEARTAQAAVDAARLELERTVIRAPIDGVVAQRHAQVGQRVQPGQSLMSVTPVAETYVDANFKENQLQHVRPGQPVELTSDLYGEDVVYHGRITGLGGGTGSAFAIIPAQNATGNWIKVVQRLPVRIALDATELAQYPLRVGLSMTASVDVRGATK